jgi:hypothetical protein
MRTGFGTRKTTCSCQTSYCVEFYPLKREPVVILFILGYFFRFLFTCSGKGFGRSYFLLLRLAERRCHSLMASRRGELLHSLSSFPGPSPFLLVLFLRYERIPRLGLERLQSLIAVVHPYRITLFFHIHFHNHFAGREHTHSFAFNCPPLYEHWTSRCGASNTSYHSFEARSNRVSFCKATAIVPTSYSYLILAPLSYSPTLLPPRCSREFFSPFFPQSSPLAELLPTTSLSSLIL